ncbi:MAG: hypothetical protein RR162_05070 [Oscillospiraceae bacterium]
MEKDSQRAKTSVGVGASSVLVIFVVLCLVTFSVLSLVSATADKKLSDKNITHMEEYYSAQAAAYKTLEELDKTLSQAYINGSATYVDDVKTQLSGKENLLVEQQDGKLTVTYTTRISDTQALLSEIGVKAPTEATDGFYTIEKWQTIQVADWSANEKLPVLTR